MRFLPRRRVPLVGFVLLSALVLMAVLRPLRGADSPAQQRLAERFKQLDKNADGKVTRDELPQPLLFRYFDVDGNGEITLDEARSALADKGPPDAAISTPSKDEPPGKPAAAPVRQGPQPLRPGDRGVGRYVSDLTFVDLAGTTHKLSDYSRQKAVVVAMTSTTCPLSKKYLPTLIEMGKRYSAQGVTLLLVNTTANAEPTACQAAADALGKCGLYIRDNGGALARAVGGTTTTDCVVLDPARTVVYHGAIDDQYGFGYSLDEPRHRYLAEALDATLKNDRPLVEATDSPGCALELPADKADAAGTDSGRLRSRIADGTAITYHNRISRLLERNCVECHRQGGVAPFSLTSFEDVASHAAAIAQVIERGAMPPWFAVEADKTKPSPWANDRSLAAADKADLLAWLAGDKPRGDERDAPRPLSFDSDWQIGKPDAVFQFASPAAVKATGVMPYQNILVDTQLPEDRWVRAIEIKPSAREVVHHVLVFVRGEDDDRRSRDEEAEGRGGFWAAYVPGNSSVSYPNGFAKRLPKGARLRFQMHYTPNGTATEDRTQLGVIYADKPPRHEVRVAGIVNTRLHIPPGAANHREVATLRLPLDVQLMGFMPHMHLRGKACKYEVQLSDGPSRTLLDVPRYDFNWQLLYRRYEPLSLSRGDTLRFTAWFDNSADNPANPDPSKTVRWGPQTYDEMHLGYVEYYVDDKS